MWAEITAPSVNAVLEDTLLAQISHTSPELANTHVLIAHRHFAPVSNNGLFLESKKFMTDTMAMTAYTLIFIMGSPYIIHTSLTACYT